MYAIVTAAEAGTAFDAQVVDGNGYVYLALTGYRTSRLPGTAKL